MLDFGGLRETARGYCVPTALFDLYKISNNVQLIVLFATTKAGVSGGM